MTAVLADTAHVAMAATVLAHVFPDRRQPFAAKFDTATPEVQADEVVALLWTDSTKVTPLIPLPRCGTFGLGSPANLTFVRSDESER